METGMTTMTPGDRKALIDMLRSYRSYIAESLRPRVVELGLRSILHGRIRPMANVADVYIDRAEYQRVQAMIERLKEGK
jgi:hypothetical protein